MENILKEINEEIKKVALSDDIDTSELTELITIRDRIKNLSITSTTQIQSFNPNFPVMATAAPNLFGGNQHRQNSVYDSMFDLAEIYIKQQDKQLNTKKQPSMHDLMFYHKFICDLKIFYDNNSLFDNDSLCQIDILEIKKGIENIITQQLKNIISENKNKEKDKIIEMNPDDIPIMES